MSIPHVEDLKKEDFTIEMIDQGIFGKSPCLCRKGIPLLRMGCSLDEVDIYITGGDPIPGTRKKEPYLLIVEDHMYHDCYTCGAWKTLEEFHQWFENPVILY